MLKKYLINVHVFGKHVYTSRLLEILMKNIKVGFLLYALRNSVTTKNAVQLRFFKMICVILDYLSTPRLELKETLKFHVEQMVRRGYFRFPVGRYVSAYELYRLKTLFLAHHYF